MVSGSEPEECSRIDTRMSQPATFRFRNYGIPVTTTTRGDNINLKRETHLLVPQYACPNTLQDASKIVNTGMKRCRFRSLREGSTRESKKSQVGLVRPTQRNKKSNTSNNPKRPISERLASTGAGMQPCNAGFSAPYMHRRGNVAMAAPHNR